MTIAALLAAALLAATPVSVAATETNNDGLTVEYVPLDQVSDWYKTVPYMQTGVCMITEHDITCATDTQWKRVTFNDRYTEALYMFVHPTTRKEPPMTTTITDVYDEIRVALGEYAGDFNIEGIANDAYIFNPTTQTFEPSPTTSFWAAVEANANANTQGN